jgi:hypothetical protein
LDRKPAPFDQVMRTPDQQVRDQAIEAAANRLARAVQFVELNARKPLFEKVMRLDRGRRVKVGLYLPGPVLIQFDPDTGEILVKSRPGQLDVLDEGCLDQ